jgi:hypothetical protein
MIRGSRGKVEWKSLPNHRQVLSRSADVRECAVPAVVALYTFLDGTVAPGMLNTKVLRTSVVRLWMSCASAREMLGAEVVEIGHPSTSRQLRGPHDGGNGKSLNLQ